MSTIDKIRKIVSECQAAKVDGDLVDLFSAQAIIAVYDALNETNRAKFVALPVHKQAKLAWKFIK